jgi:D-amino peptidase
VKVYLSADIEGVTGVTVADETNADHKDFPRFAEQMSKEVAAACEGALAAGATEILVKDAHWTARNIDASLLPRQARLIRGWSGHPQSMTDGLDGSFAASAFVGYHSRAGSSGNPLAHTMVGTVVQELRVNDIPTSEFRIAAITSNMHKVPTAFLSGDEDLCKEVNAYCDGMGTYSTFKGRGLSTESVHPESAIEEIRNGMEASLKGDLSKLLRDIPERFKVEIEFKQPPHAYRKSFYPGASLKNERVICYESKDWLDVLTLFAFVL